MVGGAGNDTYFVDNAGDAVIENAAQGNDAVFASVNYGLTANVETLVLQGSADLQGYGNGLVQRDLRQHRQQSARRRRRPPTSWSAGSATTPISPTIPATRHSRTPARASDVVFATTHYGLAAQVETLVLQGSADLQGYGNNQANTLYGNTGNNLLNGAGGADVMIGGAGQRHLLRRQRGSTRWSRTSAQAPTPSSPPCTSSLSANVETLVLQGSADLQRHRQCARQLDLRQFRQRHARRPGRRRRADRQRRQRHLRVHHRASQRRRRRRLHPE